MKKIILETYDLELEKTRYDNYKPLIDVILILTVFTGFYIFFTYQNHWWHWLGLISTILLSQSFDSKYIINYNKEFWKKRI